MSFLVRFQDGCDEDLTSNQLAVVTVDRIPTTKESREPIVSAIHEETANLDE